MTTSCAVPHVYLAADVDAALRELESRRATQHMRACDLTGENMNLRERLTTAEAALADLRRDRDVLLEAVEIIAGRRQCVDNLMSNVDVACAALTARAEAQKNETKDKDDSTRVDLS